MYSLKNTVHITQIVYSDLTVGPTNQQTRQVSFIKRILLNIKRCGVVSKA